ncbi:MAG: protein-glutamate O-methyltransferase CheR [Byssovorax sp.]
MSALARPEALGPTLLHAFGVELRRTLGLVFPETRAESLQVGIGRAAAAVGEVPASLLLRLAAGDRAAIEALAIELTIGETYFFRHAHHFDFLREALRKIAAARSPGDRIRLWSAGCSSGEEAYSMAIAALEALGPAAEATVEILGTDVNADCLARARAATYGVWSFRSVEADVRARWFDDLGGRFRVAAAPRAMVRFVARNLLDGPPLASSDDPWSRGADVIFCRNVLIYFEPPAIDRVTTLFARALAIGGQLVPGPSDPLLRSPELLINPTKDLISYTRRLGAVAALPAATPAPRAAVPPPRSALAPSPPPVAVVVVVAAPMSEVIDRARRLADGGDLRAALALLDAAVALDPLQNEAYLLRAILSHALGNHALAAADADRAILLQSSLAYAHVVAALSRARLGEPTTARRHLRNAQRLLLALDAAESAPGAGGVTAGELLSSCRQLDRSLGSPRAPRPSAARR